MQHFHVFFFVGVDSGNFDTEHGDEALFDFFHVAQGVETENQVEGGLEVRTAFHDGLEGRNSFMELAELYEGDADVLDDLETHLLAGSGDDVQSHAVPWISLF